MKLLLSFNDMQINLTDALAETGLLALTSDSDIKWRIDFFTAVRNSSKADIVSLLETAPYLMDQKLIMSVRAEVDKIIPVPLLLERLEDFRDFTCYSRLRAAFLALLSRGITQFAMPVIDDEFPCLLDVWAGSEWRPDTSPDDDTWFVLGECFSLTGEGQTITEEEFFKRLGCGKEFFMKTH